MALHIYAAYFFVKDGNPSLKNKTAKKKQKQKKQLWKQITITGKKITSIIKITFFLADYFFKFDLITIFFPVFQSNILIFFSYVFCGNF